MTDKHEQELLAAASTFAAEPDPTAIVTSFDKCNDPGTRLLFLPYEPGIYIGLALPSEAEGLSDTQSVSSSTTSRLIRSKADCKVFLDLATLPPKIQLVLTKFEMLVIGRVNSVRTQEEESKNGDEIEQQILGHRASQIHFCSVAVEQLVALQDLHFTIYRQASV